MKRLFLVLGLSLVSCSDKSPSGGFVPPPSPVEIAGVEVRDVPLYFEAMGTVNPFQVAEVKSQVNGIITDIHFTEGQWVEKGALLYSIEEAPYAIKVQEAEALLAQDLAHLKNAQKKLVRYKSLSNQDLISKVEWDELETKVALYDAMVAADEARLSAAKLDLEHCHILAPISGKVGKSSLHVGNMAPRDPLVTISQTDRLLVDFAITERELQLLTSANPSLEVFAAGGNECLASGSVTFLDHTIDPKTGLLSARGLLSTVQKPLWSGQSVRVHLFFGKKEDAKMIPLKAIKTNQSGPYVFAVKEDNTVEIRPLKLGPEEKGMIVVEEGLEEASRIVTEGHSLLYPGSKVEEVKK